MERLESEIFAQRMHLICPSASSPNVRYKAGCPMPGATEHVIVDAETQRELAHAVSPSVAPTVVFSFHPGPGVKVRLKPPVVGPFEGSTIGSTQIGGGAVSLLLLGGAAGTRSHMAQQPIGGTGVVVIIAVVELVWNAVGIKDVPFRSAERLVLVPLLSTAIVALPALRFDVEMFWTVADVFAVSSARREVST